MNKRILMSALGGTIFAGLSVLISLAVFIESSPFYGGPYNQGFLAKAWMFLNILAIAAGAVAGGHSGSTAVATVVMCLQWFLIGFVLTYWFKRRRYS